jgi:L-iditol 2-dehydrogenase
MQYLTCLSQNVVTLANASAPRPAPGEIIVKLSICGVCGTDVSKVFGDYPKPQKLGHEVVGVVHELGEGVTRFAKGQRVALAHHVPDPLSHFSRRGSETMDHQFKRSNIDPGGFSELIRVSALHVDSTVFAIPNHVPDARAVFMEPLACCLRALDRMKLARGDSALVVGVGAVGILFMPLLRDMDVAAIASDMRAERVELAKRWGDAIGSVQDIEPLCKEASDGRGVDAVILTIVNEATIRLALQCVRDGGTIMIFGGKPSAAFPLPMWDIWLREINLLTSYSATPDGLGRALTFLSTPACEGLEILISHQLTLAQGQHAFDLVHRGKASKIVIIPSR